MRSMRLSALLNNNNNNYLKQRVMKQGSAECVATRGSVCLALKIQCSLHVNRVQVLAWYFQSVIITFADIALAF